MFLPSEESLVREQVLAFGHVNLDSPISPVAGPWEFNGQATHACAKAMMDVMSTDIQGLMDRSHVPSDVKLSIQLILEETSELVEAYLSGNAAHALEEMVDTVIVAKRLAVLHGWHAPEAFARKHEANMSKLVGGFPVYDENNKVIKGPKYIQAEFDDLV